MASRPQRRREIHGGPDAHHPARTHRGRAWVGGLDVVAEADDVRFSIGVALQEAGLDENMTGREILATQGRLFGLNRSEIADRIEQLAPILEMRALDQLVSSYSGGMARRLDLAAADAQPVGALPRRTDHRT